MEQKKILEVWKLKVEYGVHAAQLQVNVEGSSILVFILLNSL